MRVNGPSVAEKHFTLPRLGATVAGCYGGEHIEGMSVKEQKYQKGRNPKHAGDNRESS
jgi:hypothetical protein